MAAPERRIAGMPSRTFERGAAVFRERAVLLVIAADRLERLVRTKPALALALIRQLARMASATDDAGRRTPGR